MRTAFALGLVLSLFVRLDNRTPRTPAQTAILNANTTAAGALKNGVLTLALEAKRTMWYPEGTSKPGREVSAFGEASKPALVPGPLIRVPSGTMVRLSVQNSLADTIVFHTPFPLRGGTEPAESDSVVVPPRARGELTFTATVPGNYFYRARTNADLDRRLTIGGAMAGAIVVDSVATPRPRDRVLVMLASTDSTAPDGTPLGDSIIFSINGRSWPNTERLNATVGDSVRWRIINANDDLHPMHLHGFYYRVDALTSQATPRSVQAQAAQPQPAGLMVVTQRLAPFASMSMTWVPERAGNWLFHCHFQTHVARPNAMAGPGHENHALTGMQGLVMGIVVSPRAGTRVETAAAVAPARRLRLVATQDSAFPDSAPSMRFMVQDSRTGGLAASAGPGFSPPIILERGKPASIMIVNHLREPTAVHWHGIELESYQDGAPGFSGIGSRVSPLIAPRDSFEARFTPPRAGTFMYHSHANEPVQHRAGMIGALIVVDSLGAAGDDRVFFLKSARAGADTRPVLDINGQPNPDTVTLHVGQPARLRFLSLALLNPNAVVILTARPDSVRALRTDSMVVRWQPIAKDGADLPSALRTPRLARQPVSMGETYDFEYTPTARGILRVEVRGLISGGLLGRVPIRVD